MKTTTIYIRSLKKMFKKGCLYIEKERKFLCALITFWKLWWKVAKILWKHATLNLACLITVIINQFKQYLQLKELMSSTAKLLSNKGNVDKYSFGVISSL